MELPGQARPDVQKKTAHASEQSREDVFKRRPTWFERQPDLDPARLVFINESGVSTKMARLRGRSLRGEHCRAPLPHGPWKTITLVAGLRLNGVADALDATSPTECASHFKACGHEPE